MAVSGNHGGARKYDRKKNINHGRTKDTPKMKLDADGNLQGAEIKCVTNKPRIPLAELVKAATGKPRLPRASVDRSLEDAFADQISHLAIPGLIMYVREFRFCSDRRWRFDLAWPALKIAVEIEGGTWANGRHNRGAGFEEDCVKYNTAESMGWYVLRLTAAQVHDGRGIEWLMKLIELKTKETK